MECHSLLELLSKYSLVLYHISPYLSTSSLLSLAATSKAFRDLVYQRKETFRYLDISTAKGACISIPPIDKGGFNWRNERIDESTTEEDFYCGPVRGIFSFLRRKNVLSSIQVLILDHVSAPAEVLRDIICEESYQVRILSVIQSTNLNIRKFQQVLRYAVRPSRPQGTPRLKGVYVFGTNAISKRLSSTTPSGLSDAGVMNSPGAQLGATINRKSHVALQSSGLSEDANPWYQNSGKILAYPNEQLNDWAMTLKECEDIIYFDAILCRGPRHDAMSSVVEADSKAFIGPRIATIALQGCEVCHSLPEETARSSQAPSSKLPLLGPVSRHSSSIKAAQQPPSRHSSDPSQHDHLLFARCAACSLDRWCEGCGKFWCEDHYSAQDAHTQQMELLETGETERIGQGSRSSSAVRLKVHLGLCIEQCLVMELMSGAGSNGMWG